VLGAVAEVFSPQGEHSVATLIAVLAGQEPCGGGEVLKSSAQQSPRAVQVNLLCDSDELCESLDMHEASREGRLDKLGGTPRPQGFVVLCKTAALCRVRQQQEVIPPSIDRGCVEERGEVGEILPAGRGRVHLVTIRRL
jgi:hypothetical protein